jgi:hypothetical protein
MSISGVSSIPIATAYTPAVNHQQQAPAPAPAKAPGKDTVTISAKAQQLANDGDTAATEIKESAAEKAGERLRDKK